MSHSTDSRDAEVEYEASEIQRDPLLQLVSLQKASGCWLLDARMAAVLGKSSEEVEKSKPAAVGQCSSLIISFDNYQPGYWFKRKTIKYGFINQILKHKQYAENIFTITGFK